METKDKAGLPSPDLKPPSAWQDIDALFDRALDEPSETRREWVRVHARDKRVAAEVLALLSVASRPGVLDSTLPAELTGGATTTETMERLTTALKGRYRIEAVLGQGGAATVFLAHEDKHNRQVVLKVLRPEVAQVDRRRAFSRRDPDPRAPVASAHSRADRLGRSRRAAVLRDAVRRRRDAARTSVARSARAGRSACRFCATWPRRSPMRTSNGSCTAISSRTTF